MTTDRAILNHASHAFAASHHRFARIFIIAAAISAVGRCQTCPTAFSYFEGFNVSGTGAFPLVAGPQYFGLFCNPLGCPSPPPGLPCPQFTVSGGVLQQRSFGLQGEHLYVTLTALSNGVLGSGSLIPTPSQIPTVTPNPATGVGTRWFFEARLRVIQISGVGVVFEARDGDGQIDYIATISADTSGCGLGGLTGRVAIGAGSAPAASACLQHIDQFHVYTMEGDSSTGLTHLWIDGTLSLSAVLPISSPPAPPTTARGFAFGDNGCDATTGSADADWDYIWIGQGSAAPLGLGQPNSAESRLQINDAGGGVAAGPVCLDVFGSTPLTMRWAGPPSAHVILATSGGPMAGQPTGSCRGLVDLNLLGASIVVNSAAGGYPNVLFQLDGTGFGQQSFSLPFPPNTPIFLQGAVLQPPPPPSGSNLGPCAGNYVLTSAFYITKH